MSKSLKHQFTDWVRKQDPEREYDENDGCGCALWQFAVSIGSDIDVAGYYDWDTHTGLTISLADTPETRSAMIWAIRTKPNTFGALLTRLEASEPEQ